LAGVIMRRGGGGSRWGLPAFSGEYGGNSTNQNVQVQQQRPFLDVEVIVFYFMPGLQIVEASNLGEARQPGFYGESQFVQDFVPLYEVRPFRPGPDQAHISLQHVEQLRKLIQSCCAQDLPDFRNTRIFPAGQDRADFLLRIVDHRSEFVQGKELAVFADSLLFVKDRPGRRNFNQQGNQDRYRRRKKQDQNAAHSIKASHQELLQIPLFPDEGAEKVNRIIAVDSAGQELHINRRIKNNVYFQLLYKVDQEAQVLFIFDSFANNNFIDIPVFFQLPNLIAADSFDEGFFSDDVVDAVPADDQDLLFYLFPGFEDELVDLKNQEQVDEKRKYENTRRESAPVNPEDINKSDTQKCPEKQPQENSLEQVPRGPEPVLVNSEKS